MDVKQAEHGAKASLPLARTISDSSGDTADHIRLQEADQAWDSDKLGNFSIITFLRYPFVQVLMFGAAVWCTVMACDAYSLDPGKQVVLPRSVELTYAFCAMAYGCNGFLAALRLLFEHRKVRFELDCFCIYISVLASSTYTLLSLKVICIQSDMKSVLYIPSRWTLYCCTMPAIWWVLAHISSYSVRRKLYVFWLNWVMLIAGGIATIPQISWGHKVFWMVLSCVPFPELCFHIWQMITDALDEMANTNCADGDLGLRFIRIYGQFSYQFFPAIYFAAFDGCLPIQMSEPLWALCDWALKMVATSSLMEANFLTIEQRREWMLRRKEDELRMNNIRELSLMMARKDDFLAAISHELCTPLNGIIGLSDALLSDPSLGLPQTLVKTMTVIKISGKRLLQLIYDILDAAKMRQEGTICIKHEEVDIKALVADVVELASTLVHKGVQLRSDIQYVPKIIGDTGRVLQVLYNLVGNACKFTTSGYIRISSRYDDARKMVGVRVSDTGCGIRSDKIQSIFEAYDQGDLSTARRYGGTGLGLHLVGELVKAHNGTIDVESVPSEGSAFTVWFPLIPPPQRSNLDVNVHDRKVNDISVSILSTRSSSSTQPPAASTGLPKRADSNGSAKGGAARVPTSSPTSTQQDAPPPSGATLPRKSSVRDVVSTLPSSIPTTVAEVAETAQSGLTNAISDTDNSMSSNRANDWSPPPLYVGEMLGQAQVMLVDSDNPERSFQWLYTDGFSLVIFNTGEAALEHLSQVELLPDVIMLASTLPDMDGCALVQSIRSMFPHYAIPIIMMSYDSSIEQMRLGLEAGCMDFIRRPCYQLELLCRVHIQLEARTPLRQRLRAGPGCLRALKLANLPSRCRIELAAGTQVVRRQYPYTAVLHVSFDWQPLLEHMTKTDNHSTLLQLHQLFHDVTGPQGLIPVTTAADGWSCMRDPECIFAPSVPSVVAVAGHLLSSFISMRKTERIPIFPKIGVAVGLVDTCLGDPLDPCTLHTIGPAVELACVLADDAAPDTIVAMSSNITDRTRFISFPLGDGVMEVGVEQLTAEQATDPAVLQRVWDFVSAPPPPVAELHDSMRKLKFAMEHVTSNGGGSAMLLETVRAALPDAATVVERTALRSTGSTDTSENTNSYKLLARQALSNAVPAPGAAALQVIELATERLTAANLSPAVIAALPPLAECLLDSSPHTAQALSALPVTMLELAFMSLQDVTALGVPSPDGIRLLTHCKRLLTNALLQAT